MPECWLSPAVGKHFWVRDDMDKKDTPLDREVQVINIGIERFAEDLRKNNVPVLQMDWRPPAGGNRKLIDLLDLLKD